MVDLTYSLLSHRIRDLESKIQRLEQAEARKPFARIKGAFSHIIKTLTK